MAVASHVATLSVPLAPNLTNAELFSCCLATGIAEHWAETGVVELSQRDFDHGTFESRLPATTD